MSIELLLALPVMLPLAGAAFTLLLRHYTRIQLWVAILTLVAIFTVSLVLGYHVIQNGVLALQIGNWTPQLGIVLVADRLTALMLLVSSFVTLAVLVYSSAQTVSENVERTPVAIYHPTYLALVAGVSMAFLAGDLFNLYVGFEVLLAASYVLLTLGGSASRVRAATTYVIVSLLSSVIFLAAVAGVYSAVGTVNLAEMAVRLDALPPGTRMILELTLLVAFGIKAALFPLSAWLPDSYPTAPAPVTAVFAGLLTKVGIYAILRLETLLFPASQTSTLLLVAAALSLVIGIFGAVAQTDLKRVLSFTLVSHMGYMLFGIGMTTQMGMAATIFYVAHHITVQSTLFLVAGLIEHRGGTTNLIRLGGLQKLAPVLAVLFFVPAMNLAGIPPFSGFIGKVGLIEAGIAYDRTSGWILIGISVLTSLLTLYAIAKIWNRAFWQEPSEEIIARQAPLPRVMGGATAAMIVFSLGLSVLAGPLMTYADEAASSVLERAPYVSAVLGEPAAEQLEYRIDDAGQRLDGEGREVDE
ncbi:Na+/H+ antiporter subunit D [Brachybacterium saurashtrense]|uniref:Na+/H+ antiporter subunit D n=1 Tax=Brachybacterium saurashtrense TaxID=556288 RepID=A0A345YPX1_9MICO|nr:Na+/H+ antiporter subunit D [Brachybacterium saurashtrense]AXK45973.1 Na+/H+ antiporter subunit D [Brachybacterium saurashtrense]RRR23712.1 Na+/H+ antiporter subunit D [Brachybacterium saurashtrense]